MLVVSAVLAGLLMLPVSSGIRQCLSAMVPPQQRKTGFSPYSITVDLSYMVGPTLAVAATTALSSTWTTVIIAVGIGCAGARC